jgi:hypothetical protein
VGEPQAVSDVQLISHQEPLPPPQPQVTGDAEPDAPTTPPSGDPEPVPAGPVVTDTSLPVRDVTMANILASVAGRNPEVGFANQRYAEAYAKLIAAQALWLPSINAGLGWNNHAGPLQASNGTVGEGSRSSLTTGLGVQTIGAGSPVVPGLFANFHSADAIFQPRIANQAAAARDAAVRTTINDLLLETALAYLELLRAHQSRAIAVDIREHAERLATATADFARSGAGNEADADRAATELSIRQNEVVRADEEIQVASARVVELLNDDPRFVLAPLEPATGTGRSQTPRRRSRPADEDGDVFALAAECADGYELRSLRRRRGEPDRQYRRPLRPRRHHLLAGPRAGRRRIRRPARGSGAA